MSTDLCKTTQKDVLTVSQDNYVEEHFATYLIILFVNLAAVVGYLAISRPFLELSPAPS